MIEVLWRLYHEGDQVRVARDQRVEAYDGRATQFVPEHLEVDERGHVTWWPHPEGGDIPAIPIRAFIDWLDNGGD